MRAVGLVVAMVVTMVFSGTASLLAADSVTLHVGGTVSPEHSWVQRD